MKITLSAPRQGISSSPHVGFADVRNMDIDSVQGITRLNNIMAKKSGTTVDAQVKWIVRDPDTSANIFALDSNGVLYKSANSGVDWTEVSDRGGSGQGLIVQWGYVFVCEDTTIDVMKISDSSWSDNWQTIDTDSLWHPMFVSKNDSKIYGGAGQYVFSIEQDTTFDPGDSGTYTFTQQALDLPASYRIKCIEELGNNLMLGTWQGTNVYDERIADIFPWDRSSVSFGQPIVMAEYGVHFLHNSGNSLIISAGIQGRIYRSDGVNAVQIAQLPHDLSGGKYLETYPSSVCSYKGKIFFGIGGGGDSITTDGCGVYSLKQTGRGNVLNLEHGISTGNFGSTTTVKATAILPLSQDKLLIAWRDGNT